MRETAMRPVIRSAIALLASLDALAAPSAAGGLVRLPDGSELARIDFDRHVAPLFGRLGCNAGSCHGSFQGRGGLHLSLFGHDPAGDYEAIVRQGMGRRVDTLDPDRSLVLLKPAGRVPHEGGRRFLPGSWEYRVIRAWIAGGARRDPALAAAERIEVRPRELGLRRPGDSGRLAIVAAYADGTESDVTLFCDVHVKDDAVAAVGPAGAVRGLRPGDTAIVASYHGLLAAARASVSSGRAVAVPDVPASDDIDREVYAKLRALGIEPSGPSSDAEFLRRVTLDAIGTLPSPEDVRRFLADRTPDKRAREIDRLLGHPMHAALWATRFLDITGCDVESMEGPDDLKPRRARMWHDWFRRRIAENMPYDQIARGILCATSRDGRGVVRWLDGETARLAAARKEWQTDYAAKPGLDLFWRRFASNGEYFPVEQMAERTATALLGVRIECAQCHKHPFDRWTQSDYRAYANVFARVRFGLSPKALAATARMMEERRKSAPGGVLPPMARVREVYLDSLPIRGLDDPTTGRPLPPRALGGPVLPDDGDAREALFAWMVRPENPYFARSFVNRVWAAYFGIGLVDPVDNFSVANPPSNERLLDALASDFVAHGYDIRRLERTILRSRAYQRSSTPEGGNLDDRGNFARAVPRMPMAEVLVDMLNAALGVPGDFGPDAPPGARAIEVAANEVRSPDLERAFRVFGRPRRTSSCDCERPRDPALPQALFLMADSALMDRLARGRLRGLLESDRCDAEIVDELYLATLSRSPTADERDRILDHLRGKADRKAAMTDVLWALINTREFILNH
jgi:hypothetical protein